MSREITWNYKDKSFKVGKSLDEYPWEENNIFPIVWYKKKLYTAMIKPETPPRINRVCLKDIYYSDKKPYWTTINKVFNIIELCQNK